MARPWGIAVMLVLACAALGCDGSVASTPPSPSPSPGPTPVRIGIRLDRVDATGPSIAFHDAVIQIGPTAADIRLEVADTTGVLPIDPAAAVTLIGWDAEGNRVAKPASVDIFVRVFTALVPVQGWDAASPYLFLTVENGRITGIEQPELP
jgi:hypothetical protein